MALEDIPTGVACRSAAGRRGVPESTLRGRISGRQTRQKGQEYRQKLSEAQQKSRVVWIIAQDDLGFPPSHAQVINFANRIAQLNGYTEPIGTHWMEAFLRRNPEVKSLRSQKPNTERFSGASTENIKVYSDHLTVPVARDIKPENCHNMDGMGIMEGLGTTV